MENNMTKAEFLAQLKAHNDERVARHGTTNLAVDRHIAKVEKMNDEEFAAHYANLQAMKPKFEAAAKSMVAEVMKK